MDQREPWIGAVERELAELDAARQLVERRRAERHATPRAPGRSGAGPSVVFSIRLDRRELAALERRAALVGIGPTVLARNLIRVGLATPVV